MRIFLSLQIALRFSHKYRIGNVVSFRSIMPILGISLGVSILVIGLSAMNGFKYELNKRILSIIPHGTIEAVNPPFNDWKSVIKNIEKVSGIIIAAPYINFTGLIQKGKKIQVISIKGVDPSQEIKFSTLSRFIKKISWNKFSAGASQIIVGQGIANALNIKQGDWITIMIPNRASQMKLLKPKYIRLQVNDIFHMKSQLDYSVSLVPLLDAQRYLNIQNNIFAVEIKVKNIFNANELVYKAGKASNTDVLISSWINTYGYMYRDIQIVRAIIYIAMFLVIGIACFSIVSTLLLVIKNKSNDIAILRTLGVKDYIIYAIFVWYGLITGLMGSLIGIFLGILVAINLTSIAEKLEHYLNCQLFYRNIYFIDFLPSKIYWIDIVIVLSASILLSLLASCYPAWRASKVNPTKILNRK